MLLFAAILLSITAIAVYFYNRLVSARNLVREGWSGVDVQLKRRHDLIPNLVQVVKGYAGHERETFEEIVRLRNQSKDQAELNEKAKLENTISSDLKRIFALVEAYPDLKADGNFRKLQDSLVEIEDALQFSRRYYNGAVRTLNTLVQSFPSNIIANIFNFKEEKFFEIELATERVAPGVSF